MELNGLVSLNNEQVRQPTKRMEAYQNQLLPGVSRTFALTIPQLPTQLRPVVTNAYLLCRIADTIEDDDGLSIEQKQHFHQQFTEVIAFKTSPAIFINELAPVLSANLLATEKNLIRNTDKVIECLQNFNHQQQATLRKCVNKMSQGMPLFERNASLQGLKNLQEMNEYCYYVAGVVGEMLTELFCDYSPKINRHQDKLMQLAPSFGQGLQMTNILKDVWEDQKRGVCWLPQDVFQNIGFNLVELINQQSNKQFGEGMQTLVKIAHQHLDNALSYSLLIPRYEIGIRRFCLWAIGLAVLTLRNIKLNPEFTSGQEVKVSRKTLKKIIVMTNLSCFNNSILKYLFKLLSKNLYVA